MITHPSPINFDKSDYARKVLHTAQILDARIISFEQYVDLIQNQHMRVLSN